MHRGRRSHCVRILHGGDSAGDTQVCLIGTTVDGIPIQGCDIIVSLQKK